jgi:hypothetical protein
MALLSEQTLGAAVTLGEMIPFKILRRMVEFQ